MSTKTLRKRIAVVAVSALTAGVLSVASAPVANATTIAEANVTLPTATNAAVGVCLTRSDTAAKVATTPKSFQKGGTQLINVVTNAEGTLTITGDAVFDSITALDTLSANQKVLTLGAVGDKRVKFNSAGAVSVLVEASNGTDLQTYYFSVVASCAVDTFSAADSFVSTAISANLPDNATTWDTAPSNVDENTTSENGGALYIRITANNAYGSALPAGAYSVTATNGALVNIGTVQNLGTATAAGTISTAVNTTIANGVVMVRIDPTTAGVAQSTVVSVTYNGVAVATKNLTFLGEAAKINVLSVKSGTVGTTGAANTGYFVYSLTDAAGNAVSGAVALAGASATTKTPAITSAKNATPLVPAAPAAPFAAIGVTANGVVGFDCTATGGVGTSNLTIVTSSGVNANTLTATVAAPCAGGINTYVVSTDKAAYKIGEIAVITITAKDSTGGPVSDASVMAENTVSVGGGTLTKAVANTDTFTAGVRTLNAQMTTEGTFNIVVSLSGTVTKSATTGYSVAPATTSVSNAQVLQSIVALIASINKQIQALQKLILARR